MTNTFFDKAKEILSEFLAETCESLDWAATEVRKQFYISVLKGLTKEYPVTALKTNSLLYFLDHENYKLEEMQFGMVPDPLYDAIKTIKNPEKDCPDFVEVPEFETEAETDAFKFVEMRQNISDDGLNEPRYPYDNEPSA